MRQQMGRSNTNNIDILASVVYVNRRGEHGTGVNIMIHATSHVAAYKDEKRG